MANGAANGSRPRRQLVISRDLGELWLALIEDGQVVEVSVRPDLLTRWLGNIVKGKVTRVVPGVRAAFVDIGLPRDAFAVAPRQPGDRPPPAPGDEVVIQVTRESQGNKGPRATFEITLPGWGLVFVPGNPFRGVSKQIADEKERERLRGILEGIPSQHGGVIARTAAAGASAEELDAEHQALVERWQEIETRSREWRAPAILWREENPALAFVRDHLAWGIDEIVADQAVIDDLAAGLPTELPSGLPALVCHEQALPLIEAFGLDRAVETALATEVRLPGGGRLVIQSTEALVAIDVNSGKDTSANSLEETALRTNLEAVDGLVRQVRLRDLGGLVVVDFIDMQEAVSKARINDALAQAFAGDRARTRILPLTDFCLAQITRQRRRIGLERLFLEPCACCGRGWAYRPEAEARKVLREARRRLAPLPPGARVKVTLSGPALEAGRTILERCQGEEPVLTRQRVVWAEGPAGIEAVTV